MESWAGQPGFNGWVACGDATLRWFDYYASISGASNINFGSQAATESSTWTEEHVWQLSWGRLPAYAYPEIYCSSHPGQWVSIRKYKPITFWGVTADNGGPNTCGSNIASYLWKDAWNSLDYALTHATAPWPNQNNIGPY